MAGINPGDNIDKRNSAMTAMANLLGVGDVIAPSVSLKVKVGDKTMTGTFSSSYNICSGDEETER